MLFILQGLLFFPDKLLSDDSPLSLLCWDGCWLSVCGLCRSLCVCVCVWNYHCVISCLHKPTKLLSSQSSHDRDGLFVWGWISVLWLDFYNKKKTSETRLSNMPLCVFSFSCCLSWCSYPLPSVFLFFQSSPRGVLRSGLRRSRSRSALAGGEPPHGLPGRPQHLPLHELLHTAQEAQHQQHVGGSSSRRDTSHHGLDGCHGLSGARYDSPAAMWSIDRRVFLSNADAKRSPDSAH